MSNPGTPLLVYGEYCSPYTRKMLAILRYRHIPYRLLQGGPGKAPEALPKPKVGLLPTLYSAGENGMLEALVDTTPLIRRFEGAYSGRSIIPDDPALSFIDYLIEDYADEWLTKAMFHYRWAHQRDARKAATLLPLQHTLGLADAEQVQAQAEFGERQTSRLHVVGSNSETAPVIEASYRSFLIALDYVLARRPFVFGTRPSAADFGLYGQLTQLAMFDPTPAKIALKTAPRVSAWVAMMDDMSGLDPIARQWCSRDELAESLGPLLEEVGLTYVPVMLANADAVSSGEALFEAAVKGENWRQPVFPYQARCLRWLRERFAALDFDDRNWVDLLLRDTGCELLVSGL